MLKEKNSKKLKLTSLILTFMLMFLLLPAFKVSAAQGLVIYTTYPSIAAKSGENIYSGITISNTTGTNMLVNLNVVSLPENWKPSLRAEEIITKFM